MISKYVDVKISPYNSEEFFMDIINNCRNNDEKRKEVSDRFKKRKEQRQHYPAISYIEAQCIDFICVNSEMNMPNKEWIDVFHTIVPVSYCDFALIDRRWKGFIKGIGLEYPEIAKVYKKREVDNFIDDLKNFKSCYETFKEHSRFSK